jgi:hypothetical protein
MKADWWYSDKFGQVGPLTLTLEQLKDVLSTFDDNHRGELLVWREGFSNWKDPDILTRFREERVDDGGLPGWQASIDGPEPPQAQQGSAAWIKNWRTLVGVGCVAAALSVFGAIFVQFLTAKEEFSGARQEAYQRLRNDMPAKSAGSKPKSDLMVVGRDAAIFCTRLDSLKVFVTLQTAGKYSEASDVEGCWRGDPGKEVVFIEAVGPLCICCNGSSVF